MGQALAKFIVTFFFYKTLSRSPATGSTSSKYLLKSTVFLHTRSLFHLVLTALYFQQGQVMLTVDENLLLINMMDLIGEVWDHFYQWETLLSKKKKSAFQVQRLEKAWEREDCIQNPCFCIVSWWEATEKSLVQQNLWLCLWGCTVGHEGRAGREVKCSIW